VGTRYRICQKVLGGVGYMRGPCCYQAMSKFITVKSVVGVILCLCVLCNYTEVVKCAMCICVYITNYLQI
jgi:hypothetical protein